MLQKITTVQHHARSLIDFRVDQIIMINENGRAEEMSSENKIGSPLQEDREAFLLNTH